jgi:hypothetical protein
LKKQKKSFWPKNVLFEKEDLEEMIENNKIIVPQLETWAKQIVNFVKSGEMKPLDAWILLDIINRQIYRAGLISKIYKKRLWKK